MQQPPQAWRLVLATVLLLRCARAPEEFPSTPHHNVCWRDIWEVKYHETNPSVSHEMMIAQFTNVAIPAVNPAILDCNDEYNRTPRRHCSSPFNLHGDFIHTCKQNEYLKGLNISVDVTLTQCQITEFYGAFFIHRSFQVFNRVGDHLPNNSSVPLTIGTKTSTIWRPHTICSRLGEKADVNVPATKNAFVRVPIQVMLDKNPE